MAARQARRISRELTPEEQARLEHYRQQIVEELPDLIEKDRMRKEAREENTLSGELRRAIHGSGMSLETIGVQAGITSLMVDEFLTGERTLRSDVLDRLAKVLGYELHRVS
jgi:transcriptional regulator with XRE-family HTH domain